MGSMAREKLPDRRKCWTQKVRIEGQTYYLSCGEYSDGRLGEVFVDAQKNGTFTRGVLGALARLVSIALQSGSAVEDVASVLRHLNFPPQGTVEGSAVVTWADSVPDWIAQEMLARYGQGVKVESVPVAVP